jgi:hypothetical protein
VAWLFLVVLDAGQYQVRCRACSWVSPKTCQLPAARRAWVGHRCTGRWVLVVLLVTVALLAAMAAGRHAAQSRTGRRPCRLVPSRAGAWSDATCLRAPARHQAGGAMTAPRTTNPQLRRSVRLGAGS